MIARRVVLLLAQSQLLAAPTAATPAPTGVGGTTAAPTAATPAPTGVGGTTPAPTAATPAPTGVGGTTAAPTAATPAPTGVGGTTPAPTAATVPTTTVAPVPEVPENVTGNWFLQVSDTATFTSDVGVKKSIQQSLAQMAGNNCQPGDVTLDFKTVDTLARRLAAGDVEVDYNIHAGNGNAANSMVNNVRATNEATADSVLKNKLIANNAQAAGGTFQSKGITAQQTGPATPQNKDGLALGLGIGLGVGIPLILGLGLGLGLGLKKDTTSSDSQHNFNGGWVWPNGTMAGAAAATDEQFIGGAQQLFSKISLQAQHFYTTAAIGGVALVLLVVGFRAIRIYQATLQDEHSRLMDGGEDEENMVE